MSTWFDNEGRDSDCRQASRAALGFVARAAAIVIAFLILFGGRL